MNLTAALKAPGIELVLTKGGTQRTFGGEQESQDFFTNLGN